MSSQNGIFNKLLTKKLTDPPSDSYQSLLGQPAWLRLSPLIRERFAQHQTLETTIYTGTMAIVWRSSIGALFAQACRLIGTPLPLHSENNVPTDVYVYRDEALGGITWDRHYYYRNHNCSRVRSTKRIETSGLVECVGRYFGMQLLLKEENSELHFISQSYFLRLGHIKLTIPHLLSPGKTHVTQRDLSNGRFQFTLDIEHPFFGKTFYQKGTFIRK